MSGWVDPTAFVPPLFGGATNGNNYTPYFPGGFPPGPPLNNPLNYLYGPSSRHVGSAHHLLGDGADRFILQNINILTYDTLVTRAVGEVVGEFQEGKAKVSYLLLVIAFSSSVFLEVPEVPQKW